jgi:hypothetical protein
MDAVWANKWADALESGEYKQGYGHLNKGGSFCCLGVLTDLVIKEHPELCKSWKMDDDGFLSIRDEQSDEYYFFPKSFCSVTGLQSITGRINGSTLARMNDGQRLGFREIAAVIRSNAEDL